MSLVTLFFVNDDAFSSFHFASYPSSSNSFAFLRYIIFTLHVRLCTRTTYPHTRHSRSARTTRLSSLPLSELYDLSLQPHNVLPDVALMYFVSVDSTQWKLEISRLRSIPAFLHALYSRNDDDPKIVCIEETVPSNAIGQRVGATKHCLRHNNDVNPYEPTLSMP